MNRRLLPHIAAPTRSAARASALFVAIALLLVLAACSRTPVVDPTPTIDAFAATLTVGATVEVTGHTDRTMPDTYAWWSSDESVATVTDVVVGDVESTALLTAVGAGSTTLSFGDPTAGASDASVDSIVVTVVEPEPEPVEIDLAALASWWSTTPAVELSTFGTLRIQMTFEKQSGGTITFDGTESGPGPADELQIWTNPNVADPVVTFDAFPEGSYGVGATFSWDITIDVSALDPSETGLSIRPQPDGTFGPDSLELVDQTLTLSE